ncbi:MAG: Bax inhibitor-1/YccA family protein [Phycisphaerales bacterium]|nr:Bax inhibitor-1/YccA family protein [Phycisphaerales bacterium]
MSNPVLDRGFQKPQRWDEIAMGGARGGVGLDTPHARALPGTMTLQGTILASFVLLGLCAASAYFVYFGLRAGTLAPSIMIPLLLGSSIGSIILGFVITMNPRSAVFLSPVGALAQGVLVGAISYVVPQYYKGVGEGVVLQALGLTFGIFAMLLVGYASGLVRLGGVAARVVITATAGVCFFYLASFVASLFGFHGMRSVIWDNSPIGIGFSAVVVVLASLNLVLNFQMIDEGQRQGMPRYMEWYGAYGLLVTVVWLYLEILRLLAKLQSRD